MCQFKNLQLTINNKFDTLFIKKITLVNTQDHIKKILFIEERDSYVDIDELLKSCVHITVAENRFI